MRSRAAVVLLVGLLAIVTAGCGGGDDTAPTPETVEGTSAETTDTTETTTATEDGGGQGNAEAGAEVFVSAGCGGCHTLAAAGSSGTIGPNLDDAQPSFDLAVERVTNGSGAMPAFQDQLTEQQISDVAAYVSESAGQG